jgi:hypothetical protein
VSQSFSVVLLLVVGFIKPAGLVIVVGACRGGHFLLQLCFGEEGSFEARAMFVVYGFRLCLVPLFVDLLVFAPRGVVLAWVSALDV